MNIKTASEIDGFPILNMDDEPKNDKLPSNIRAIAFDFHRRKFNHE